jgi:hypothetical protein
VLIGFFVLYMAFEAYKTAEAHRMGVPPPDPLGLDKLFGVQETTAHHSTPASTTSGVAPNPPAAAPLPLQVPPPPPPARDNAPTGAIILIALGVAFLLSNFGMFNGDQLWPLFLIGIGLWIAYKRIGRPTQGGRP